MKISLILLIFCLLCAAIFTGYSERYFAPTPDVQKPPLADTVDDRLSGAYAAPNFSFTTLDGISAALSDYRGRVVVLNFWASWCAPCVIEFPQMIDLANAHPDKMVLLFVSIDEDRATINRFLETHGQGLPRANIHLIHDPKKAIAQTLYNTFKIPETYLIDPNGMIIEKIIGADIIWNDAAMKDKISKIYKN